MSKGSLFWANASGKLGESVFYRAGGEQRNRTYVKNIKNPKTEGQMKNRIQMTNWIAMYRRLKPLLSQTFTNRPSKESGFNAFVKANKSRLLYAITNEMFTECDYIPFGAKVSSGTIVCNIQPEMVEYRNLEESGTPPKYYTQMLSVTETELEFAANKTIEDYLLGKDVYKLMTANGNPMQLPTDFKVIVLWGSVDIDDETGEWATGGMPLSYRVYDCNATNESEGTFIGNESFKHQSALRAKVTEIVKSGKGEASVVKANGLMLGGTLTPEDSESDVFGMIIFYDGPSGKNANNAFIYGYNGAKTYSSDFSEGGDVFNEILSWSGVAASGGLTGSSTTKSADFKPYTIPLFESEGGEYNPDDEEP